MVLGPPWGGTGGWKKAPDTPILPAFSLASVISNKTVKHKKSSDNNDNNIMIINASEAKGMEYRGVGCLF